MSGGALCSKMTALGKIVLSGANGLKIVLCLFWLGCLQTAKFAKTYLRARMNKMTNLERRALLGDRQAQEECTRSGIVLGCPRCGKGGASTKYFIGDCWYECPHCHSASGFHSSAEVALADWNTRQAPPIGRCVECKYRSKDDPTVCSHPITGLFDVLTPDDFCSYFEPAGAGLNERRNT